MMSYIRLMASLLLVRLTLWVMPDCAEKKSFQDAVSWCSRVNPGNWP